ncbi:MAG: glycoside hydrolase family 3 C-terminal domain-containing protein, partial [Mucilaginibacter sp.]
VYHGTDSDCGTEAYKYLIDGVKNGAISEKQIDISLKRLFTVRFKLGMFDPVGKSKYDAIGLDTLNAKSHQKLALQMARQSIVLLKNEHSLLPLSTSLKSITVIGPNADNKLAVLGNYNGVPAVTKTPLGGIVDMLGSNKVYYEKGINYTDNLVALPFDVTGKFNIEGHPGFEAQYFNNSDFKGDAVYKEYEADIDHSWAAGAAVVPGIKATGFAVKWNTTFTPDSTGTYNIKISGRDYYRLSIDGSEKIADWRMHGQTSMNYSQDCIAGKTYHITLEYAQSNVGNRLAAIKFVIGKIHQSTVAEIAARAAKSDVIVYVGGISPELEGEEMPVSLPGFSGGDRTSINLPEIQTELLKALKNTGKPVVFVIMTGSAIAMEWENTNIPAIVNAWYDGQSAGTAIADVLFGRYNPSGHLPVTFYKNNADLPPFDDYSMAKRTYKYFTGSPAYPFGYGLSYTSFMYQWKQLPKQVYHSSDNIKCSVIIENKGKMDGDDVPQAYISFPNTNYRLPIKQLCNFKRLAIKQKHSKLFEIAIPVSSLMKWNKSANKLQPIKGTYKITVGQNSRDAKLVRSFKIE